MEKLWIILSIIALIVVGYVKKRLEINKDINSSNFTLEYHNKLVELLNSQSQNHFDNSIYNWLTENAHKMQDELGDTGVMHFADPLTGMNVPKYQLLLNFLPEI